MIPINTLSSSAAIFLAAPKVHGDFRGKPSGAPGTGTRLSLGPASRPRGFSAMAATDLIDFEYYHHIRGTLTNETVDIMDKELLSKNVIIQIQSDGIVQVASDRDGSFVLEYLLKDGSLSLEKFLELIGGIY